MNVLTVTGMMFDCLCCCELVVPANELAMRGTAVAGAGCGTSVAKI